MKKKKAVKSVGKEKQDSAPRSRTVGPSSEEEVGQFGQRVRTVLGKTSVRSFARDVGIDEKSLRQYMAGATDPSRRTVIAMAKAGGVTVQWLATGEGPMRKGELGDASKTHKAEALLFDPELLVDVVSGVEEGLVDAGATMDPEKKGQLLVAIYQLYSDSGAAPDKEAILRLVRSAA